MTVVDGVDVVEFDLLSGDEGAFTDLEIVVADGGTTRANPIALLSGGSMMVLVNLTQTAAEIGYRPDRETITSAYVVSTTTTELFLQFPTGEGVSLSPLLP